MTSAVEITSLTNLILSLADAKAQCRSNPGYVISLVFALCTPLELYNASHDVPTTRYGY